MKRLIARIIIQGLAFLVIGGCTGADHSDRDTNARNSVKDGRQGEHRQTQLGELVSFTQSSADEVVKRLAELGPDGLPGMASNGVSPREQLRLELYRRLKELGDSAVPALVRGLTDPDVLIRRNVVLFLVAGQGFFPELRQSSPVRVPLPSLVMALKDSDATVRAWAAQTIGSLHRDAVEAVPALIDLLADKDEGSRNSACIALREIGPAAKDALPALRQALSDPSASVRGLATPAIEAIEGRTNANLSRKP